MILLLSAVSIQAQNLIPNPGFEQCDKCDSRGFKELGIASGANDPIDWNAATGGTPDFISTQPHSGKRHGGFYCGFPKYEYLTNHFTRTLTKGAVYRFSFWVMSGPHNPNYLLDEIGVYFQKGPAVYPQAQALKQLNPNYNTPDGEFIGGKEYKQYSFEYTACGEEDHFIVGRIKPLGQGDTSFVGTKYPANPGNEYMYYFVDDFEMLEIKPAQPVDLLPATINLCPGEVKKIGVPELYKNNMILWSTGETTPDITIASDHLISVEIHLNDACNTILRDTVKVIRQPLINVKILSPDSVCIGDTIALKAICNGDCFDYTWSNGVKGSEIMVSQSGIYQVQVKTLCNDISAEKEIFASGRKIASFVSFPNVITLNGEMENQRFGPYVKPEQKWRIQSYELIIYNRWGKKVFGTNKTDDYWSPDEQQPMDVYLFHSTINYMDCNTISKNIIKGSFNLIR